MGLRKYDLYIDGQWVAGRGGELEVLNPATEEVIGRVPEASVEDIHDAVAAARRAFEEGPWPRMRPAERSKLLVAFHEACQARKQEILELNVAESGSTQLLADFLQVTIPLEHFRWFAERAATFPFEEPLPPTIGMGIGQGVVRKEPAGVVAAITPFNFPFFLNLWKLGPALAAGNTVVLKPSPYTPLEAFLLGELADEVGLPSGVLNIVTGDVDAGRALTTSDEVDIVSFTGSDVVGRKVMAQAAEGLKKTLLELGGKSALIVCAGSNLDKVVPQAIMGFTTHCGQGCALTTRILVQRSIHDDLVERLRTFLGFMSVGDPADPSVMMGPLIREAQRERVERYVELGRTEGAEVAFGGGRPAGLDRGFFVQPTLFTGVDNSMRIAREEIFGPVGCVIPFDDVDDAVRIANDSPYGLAGGVWHPDPVVAYDMASRVRAGTITVNGGGGGFGPYGPFGGFKQSGIGRELSDYGLLEYLELKTVQWGAAQP